MLLTLDERNVDIENIKMAMSKVDCMYCKQCPESQSEILLIILYDSLGQLIHFVIFPHSPQPFKKKNKKFVNFLI